MSIAVPTGRGGVLESRLRTGAIAALSVAFVLTLWSTVGRDRLQANDFGAYYRAAVRVAAGETPYRVDEYGPLGTYCYAPAYAYALIPISHLDYVWACRCWMVLNWLATLGGFYLSLKLVRGDGRPLTHPWVVLCLGALPVLTYFQMNLAMGQASMFTVLGCLGWAVCRRNGRPFAGGVLLALSCACKLYPLALVPYLVLRGDWRGLAGVAAGLLAVFLVPAAWVGLDGSLAMHADWLRHTVTTHVPEQTFRPGNQSLLAQLARLPVVSNGYDCYSPERLAELSRWYPLLAAALGAVLYAVIALGRGDPARMSRGEVYFRENVHLAVLFVFMTLAGPRSWRCNFVALVFPCLLLAVHVWERRAGYRFALAALGLMLVMSAWPTWALSKEGWSWNVWLLQGKHFWGAVAVGAGCLALLPGSRVEPVAATGAKAAG